MRAPRHWAVLVLLPIAVISTTLGILAVTKLAFATGGSPACMPYTTGVPNTGTLSFKCAPQTCAAACAETGGPTPHYGGPPEGVPVGTEGTMKCKCGETIVVATCLRTVKWKRETETQYTRSIVPCNEGTCIIGTCTEKEPIEGIPGTWCDCP